MAKPSIKVSIKRDNKKIEKHLTAIERRVLPKAIPSALNRTIDQVNTETRKNIAADTALKQKQITPLLKKFKANKRKLVAALQATGRAFNIIEFVTKSKQAIGAFKSKRGVTSKPWGTTRVFPSTFIGRGKISGKLLVFKSRGDSKKAGIEAVHGPSVPRSFSQTQILAAMDNIARSKYSKILRSRIKFYASKIK